MSQGDRSDALVFFGATGDLAHKMIFPALQALVKAGRLDVPVIGVAKAGWGLDAAPRPRPRQPQRVRRWRRTDRLRQARRNGFGTSTATTRIRAPSSSSGKRSATAARPLHYLAIPPSLFGSGREGASAHGAARRTPGWSWRNRSAATSRRLARSIVRCSRSSPSRRSSGSITISARKPCRTSSTFASATRSSSRSGIETSSRACRSRWPRASGSKAAASSTRRPERFATSCRTTCCKSSRVSRWRRPNVAIRTRSADAKGRLLKAIEPARRRPTSSEASSTGTGASRTSLRTRRSRRMRPCVCRSTAGDGPASRSTSGRASASR